jgi:hypothetical protein
MRIKDTEHVKEIKYEQMIAVGNVDTEDPRHINVGNLSDFVESNIKTKGTFASNDELQGVYSAIGDLTGNIGYIDDKFTQQFTTVGEQIAELEQAVSGGTSTGTTTETWTFQLENGTTINKNVLLKK